MKACNLPEKQLQMWLDGEVEPNTPLGQQIERHLDQCEGCAQRLESWEQAGAQLRDLVDVGVGEVEPLLALQQIRTRIAEAQERSVVRRIQTWWADLWTFNRRAMAGVGLAAAMGALTAPAAVYLLGTPAYQPTTVASVVVESVEFDGTAKAVVYRPEGGNTTIIWMEEQEDGDADDLEDSF